MDVIMPPRVLIIDDGPEMTDQLTIVLQSREFIVKTANGGEEGLKAIHETHPEVVILDLKLPGMDGRQVCSQIRAFSEVPILILSAMDNPGNVASALEAGADDYLIKPVPINMLVEHVQKLAFYVEAGGGHKMSAGMHG